MDELKKRKILVTGGAGFIGSHLVDRLAPDNKVTVLDNLSRGTLENLAASRKYIDFVKGDILDKELVSQLVTKADYVFHLAARTSVVHSVQDPEPDMVTNITGTFNVLEACRKTKIKRLVFSSSAAIFGDAEYLPVDENHPLNPKSPYAASKMAAEKYVQAYWYAYGVPSVSLRYFNIYGPRQDTSEYANVISIFLNRFKAGQPVTVYGDGEQTRDFIYVEDAVESNILAALRPKAPGEFFNIATGEVSTINDVLETVRKITNHEGRVAYAPERAGEIKHSCANIGKAGRFLGYSPKIPLTQGIKLTWDSM